MVQQRSALVPRHVRGAGDDVVAVQRGDGNEGEVGHVELGREIPEFVADLVEPALRPVHQIHLVDAQHHVPHPEQRREEGVPAGLLDDAVAGVDEDERQVGGGRPGDHVARVLLVTGSVGDDECPVCRGEIAIGDVDRDALFAFGAQAVGEQGEIGAVGTAVEARAGHRLELVLEDGLRVEQQSTDERGLAVVDAAGGGDAQQVDIRNTLPSCGLPFRHRRSGRPPAWRRVR